MAERPACVIEDALEKSNFQRRIADHIAAGNLDDAHKMVDIVYRRVWSDSRADNPQENENGSR